MKNIHSKLTKFVNFVGVEIKPFDNQIDDEIYSQLEKNKVFNHYVKSGEFLVTDLDSKQDEDLEVDTDKYIDFKELSDEDLQAKYTVDELKSICKDLGLRNYKDLNELELIEKIKAKI